MTLTSSLSLRSDLRRAKARTDKEISGQIFAEMTNYKDRMLRFKPGRQAVDKERALIAIFSTKVGAVEIGRMMPDAARESLLASRRNFLFRSF